MLKTQLENVLTHAMFINLLIVYFVFVFKNVQLILYSTAILIPTYVLVNAPLLTIVLETLSVNNA